MKKTLLFIAGAVFALQTPVLAQRTCGDEALRASIIARDPGAAAFFEDQKRAMQVVVEEQSSNPAAQKTTAVSAIPVIFHIVLDTAKYIQLGGATGVKRRVDSQIAVLTRDFNRGNFDSTLIPAGFKPLFGNAGIKFGLAHTAPNGKGTPGYEVRIVTATSFTSISTAFSAVKHSASGGLDGWDYNKYFNVWVLNFDDANLLGIATPRSFTPMFYPANEMGVCVNYRAFGKRVAASDVYISGIDKGRTLTHEVGHFFTMRHIWGDDAGCPASGGPDDGIADTPPQADQTFGSPTGPIFDACVTGGNGIMWMNYMDYTDDGAMHMFTKNQATAMASKIATTGENYSLTQNPNLLLYPVGVAEVNAEPSFEVYPNPSAGVISIALGTADDDLSAISVTNMLGQQVMAISTAGTKEKLYSIDLSAMSKGIYLVKCNFASGSVTRKITLQ
ncbi:MAG: zinc-dependent metalloprotease [Bacteroidota bacterium]